jgi:hypothetical protein
VILPRCIRQIVKRSARLSDTGTAGKYTFRASNLVTMSYDDAIPIHTRSSSTRRSSRAAITADVSHAIAGTATSLPRPQKRNGQFTHHAQSCLKLQRQLSAQAHSRTQPPMNDLRSAITSHIDLALTPNFTCTSGYDVLHTHTHARTHTHTHTHTHLVWWTREMRRICGPCRAAGDLSLNGARGIADGAALARGAVQAVAVETAVWCWQRVSLVVSRRLIITSNLATLVPVIVIVYLHPGPRQCLRHRRRRRLGIGTASHCAGSDPCTTVKYVLTVANATM